MIIYLMFLLSGGNQGSKHQPAQAGLIPVIVVECIRACVGSRSLFSVPLHRRTLLIRLESAIYNLWDSNSATHKCSS
jgi:hypothetical protein